MGGGGGMRANTTCTCFELEMELCSSAKYYLTYFVDLPDDETVVVPPGEGVLAGVAGAAGGDLHLL